MTEQQYPHTDAIAKVIGIVALVFLALSLTITPARKLLGAGWLTKLGGTGSAGRPSRQCSRIWPRLLPTSCSLQLRLAQTGKNRPCSDYSVMSPLSGHRRTFTSCGRSSESHGALI